jgi:hypothetical protein
MVVLVAIGLSKLQLSAVEDEIHRQASLLPRGNIVIKALANSYVIQFDTLAEAMKFTNDYAPEHLILYTSESSKVVDMVQNAGSVFVGAWSPVSCGDYASGTNHVPFPLISSLIVDPSDIWICENVQWSQYTKFPKAHYESRTYIGGSSKSRSHSNHTSRSRRLRRSCREYQGQNARIGSRNVTRYKEFGVN